MKKIFCFCALALFLFTPLSNGYAQNSTVKEFVTRFYQECLNREPDSDGLEYWVNTLISGDRTGTELAQAFVQCQEFVQLETLDSDYVTILYKAFFNRDPDPDGYNYWINLLSNGTSRSIVLDGFTSAQEFYNLCEQYQISVTDHSGKDFSSSNIQSFFPSPDDNIQSIIWRYRINNGSPISATYEGIPMDMTFSDLVLSINKTEMIREGSFSGSVYGQASGRFSVDFTENLEPDSSVTLINSQVTNLNMVFSVEGIEVDVDAHILTLFESPVEWFLDNDSLDTLALGTYSPQGVVSASVDGFVDISISGYGNENEPVSLNAISDETWTIVQKLDTFTVNGTTYNNVVVVERQTLVPVSLPNNAGNSISITYWVAKGIGMIKGIGQYQMMGQPLTIELIDTNLN